MYNQDDGFQIVSIISQFKAMETLEQQLNFVLILLYSLGGDKQTSFEADILKFEKIMSNVPFMRAVKHRDSLVRDYSAEYFGKDYSDDDPFLYQEELENKISEISLELLGVIGRVVNVMSDNDVNIGDEA